MTLKPGGLSSTKWDLDKIVTFDIETEGWTDPVSIGALHPQGEYRAWNTGKDDDPIGEFINYMMKPVFRGFRFVAHNGGKFDFGFILTRLLERDDTSVQILKNGGGRLFLITITDEHGHNRYLQDSFALLPRDLDSLMEAYTDMEVEEFDEEEYDRISQNWESMDQEFRNRLTSYLKNDCEGLRKVLEGFTSTVNELSESDVGCSLTMGSTTMEVYKHDYLENDAVQVLRSLNGNSYEKKVRKSYRAGRTEVFRMTADEDDYPLYHYDINSLFPHCYTNYKLPVETAGYIDNIDEQVLDKIKSKELGGAVKISGYVPDDVKYPVLPTSEQVQQGEPEKVVFRTGEIEGWFMAREVLYALEVGALKKVDWKEGVLAENKNQFEEYGSSMYDLKNSIDKSENPALYKTVKLLLNSFYGKFGMKRSQEEIVQVGSKSELEDEEEKRGEYHKMIGHTEEDALQLFQKGVVGFETESEANYIIPRIASSITAQARIEMHKWFKRITDAGGKIYYCDTDSVVCDIPLEDIEPEPESWVNEELGGMDKENVIDEFFALAPKTYAEKPTSEGEELDGLVLKGKGMKKLHKHNDFEDFKEAIQEDDPQKISTEWVAPEGLASTLKKFERNKELMKSKKYERSVTQFDNKRRHNKNKTDSKPLSDKDIIE